jgi:hypothetical protein
VEVVALEEVVLPVLGDASGLGLGDLVEEGDHRVLDLPGVLGVEAGLAGLGLERLDAVGGAAMDAGDVVERVRLQQQEHVIEAGLRQVVDALHGRALGSAQPSRAGIPMRVTRAWRGSYGGLR